MNKPEKQPTIRITPYGIEGLGLSISHSNIPSVYETITIPKIEKVIFQKAHTIIVWADRSKTVVKCSEEDFDKEKGFAMAVVKKIMKRNEFKRLLDNADYQDK